MGSRPRSCLTHVFEFSREPSTKLRLRTHQPVAAEGRALDLSEQIGARRHGKEFPMTREHVGSSCPSTRDHGGVIKLNYLRMIESKALIMQGVQKLV